VWPAGAVASTLPGGGPSGDAWVERLRVERPGGFTGAAIGVQGMENGLSDVLVRYEAADGTTRTTRLTGASPAFTITAVPRRFEVATTYTRLGVEHILLGIDHLLFVLGLLLLVGNWRRLIVTVTAFTVAHSITLAAATLGLVHVPQAPVEAVIALSVMFVAAEILRTAHGRASLTARTPWLVAFVFGLLHGLGFAGALREIGLPQTDIPLALLFFNVGVEIGQLTFIAAVVAVLAVIARLSSKWQEGHAGGTWGAEALVRTPLAYLIGCTAAYWTIDRTVGFF